MDCVKTRNEVGLSQYRNAVASGRCSINKSSAEKETRRYRVTVLTEIQ